MKLRMPALGLLAIAAGTDCRVGNGVGAADGTLFVHQCTVDEDYGSASMPKPYRLDPQFFAGEPLEDLKKNGPDNRLIIRLQRSGKRVEVNNLLTFDIISTFEVARCVSGLVRKSVSCDWGADGQGPPRVRVGVNHPIRANFVPRTTCPYDMGRHAPAAIGAYVVATALADEDLASIAGAVPRTMRPPAEWESWIEFAQFGSVTPGQGAPQDNFRVDFGERLHASRFHMTDDRFIQSVHQIKPTWAAFDISGVLDGYFDFDLERGQGAQTFP